MIKSLYSGVTGLKAHNQKMDVIGNNIANVNTTGYKAGTVTFKDVYYQTRQNSNSGTYTQGGINPAQVGYGVRLGTISNVMSQSGFTYSDSVLDMSLTDSGFFQVMDSRGDIFYTRLGRFELDDFGNLTDANGNVVLGVSGDPTNRPADTQRINIQVPAIEDTAASFTKNHLDKASGTNHNIIIRAAEIGTGGNVSVTIRDLNRKASEVEAPFATMSGTNLTVRMDLSVDYEDMAINGRMDAAGNLIGAAGIGNAPDPAIDGVAAYANWEKQLVERVSMLFTEDMNEAIRLGGVNLETPLEVEFVSVPEITNPLSAENYLVLPGGDPENRLNFTMDVPGAYGNGKQINVVVDTNLVPGDVKAQWTANNSLLTITVSDTDTLNIQDIQDAIIAASRGNDNLMITVTGGSGGAAVSVDTTAISTTKPIVGLKGGKDSYFNEAFTEMGTSILSGGAFYTEQTPADVRLFVDEDGIIYGEHGVHGMLLLGRIDIADFTNPEGLQQVGMSYFTQNLVSGPPIVKIPRTDTDTKISSGSLEMSNVDLSNEFSDMIITQRGFQANSRIVTVSDSMLEELVNLKR